MSTSMGPVESWLRFIVGIGMLVGVTAILSWWVIETDGPLWMIAIAVVVFGAMGLITYERLIGW